MILLLMILSSIADDNQVVIKNLTPSMIHLQVQFSNLNQTENRPITRFIIANSPPKFEYKIGPIDSSSEPNNSENFNNIPIKINAPLKFKDCNIYPVVISPSYLNKNIKIYYKYIEITLSYERSPNKLNLSSSLNRVFKNLILNFQDNGDTAPSGYLIITPNSFYDEVLPLAQWKEKKGWTVTIATLSQTGSTPGEIKNYISTAYHTWSPPPEYVLLIGDKDSLPPFSLITPPSTSDYGYTLIDGNDFFGELLIGRLPANNANELNTIIAKIINYEKTPYMTSTSWFKKGLMVAANYPAIMTTPIPTKQWVREKLIEYGFNNVDTVYYPPTSGGAPISSSINQGVTFVNYRAGDGNLDGWIFPSFTNDDILALSNGWKLPIVTSITCYTGNFGAQTCFGEAWLRAGNPTTPKGGVGFIGASGATTSSRWNNCLDYGIYWAILKEDIYNLGPAFYRGKMELFMNFPDDTTWAEGSSYYFHTYNLLGDPSLDIWTDVPDTFVVYHNATIPVGTNNLSIQVKNSTNQAVENAMVSLYKENEVKEVAFTDGAGNVTFNFSTSSQDTLFVTVTKHNFKPHCGYCLVNNSSVYVGYYDHTISDPLPNGNNNGEVNAGEIIQMAVTLKNYGTSTTVTNISAKLAVNDSLIVITDSIKTCSNIAPGGTAITAPFVYNVSANAKNNHVIEFVLFINSSQGNWNSSIWIDVRAPEFVFQRHQILDGGNSLLEPGETSDLIISIKNIGGLVGNNIAGILRSNNPGVNVIDSMGSFGSIAIGDSATNGSNHFRVSASSSLAPGHHIDFLVLLSGENDFKDTVAFETVMGIVNQTKPFGPDGYGYFAYDDTDIGYSEKPSYTWIEIDPALGGSGNIIILADNETKTVPLPFNFKFYGDLYNKISISSNGFVALDSTWITDMYNWHIPAAGGPSLLVAPFWDDLDPNATDSSGNVCYRFDSQNHRFIIEYSRIQHIHDPTNPTPADLQTFEVVLFDPQYYSTKTGDGEILFQYKKINNDDHWHNYATVGIEDKEHTAGLEYSYANIYPSAAAPLVNNRAIKFTTDPTDTFPYPGVNEQITYLNSQIPILEIYPNPFKDRIEIRYATAHSARDAKLKIYNVTGRLVKNFSVPTTYSLLPTPIIWDGTDDHGCRVPEGVYFINLFIDATGETENHGITRKVIFLR